MLFRPAVSQSILLAITAAVALGSPITTGDVLVAVGNSQVKVFDQTGTLLQTLNDASGTPFTTGMVFDGSGNLYVTNFTTDTISKFDSNGNLIASTWATSNNTPESILVNAAGNFLVGGPGANVINEYTAAGGSPSVSFTVQGGNGTGGTDWTDLEANQTTLLYDGEGTEILSYNLATKTQNPPFATGLPGSPSVYEFRIIPTGTLAGDVLAADSSEAILLNASGAVIQTYTLPGNEDGDFALNLDPDGTDFWTADSFSGNVWEVNIATGHIDQQWNSGSPGLAYGLVVAGQITASGPPPPSVPEPGTGGLLGAGVALAAAVRYRRAPRSESKQGC